MQALEVRQITKRYGAQLALHNVSFSASGGQVVAICGENGAGKSTLMSILSGNRQPDSGEVLINGVALCIKTPQEAFSLGIYTVYQELSLLPALSVTENLLLGSLPTKGLRIDWAAAHATAERCLGDLGFPDIDVRRNVRDLSVAFQQIVEIAKALSHGVQLLVLDEPTGVLTERETHALFAQIEKVRSKGAIVLYISHRLEEVLEIADRVIVLKDGSLVDEMSRGEASIGRVVHSMVGRELQAIYPTPRAVDGAVVLRVKALSGRGFRDVSLELRAGEILALFGLIGSGRSELARAIFGANPRTSGMAELLGNALAPRGPGDAIKAGLGMLTEERKHDGLLLDCNVLDNGSLASLERFSHLGVLCNRARREAVSRMVSEMSIRPHGLQHRLRNFSGGNQQKVVLAKWLLVQGLSVLILDEPTRGVDVGTKVEIYRLIAGLAERGVAILLISSELPEILGMSHRVGVMREGRLVACLARDNCSEKDLVRCAAGVDEYNVMSAPA